MRNGMLFFVVLHFLFVGCKPKAEAKRASKTIQIDTIIKAYHNFYYHLGALKNNEGTGLNVKPEHAEINEFYSDGSTGEIVYKYKALENYEGKDFVELYRDRNAVNEETNLVDTIKINFTIDNDL